MVSGVFEKSEVVEDAARAAAKLRSMVSDATEDGMRSARRAIKRGRDAAEDAIEGAEHAIKQKPLASVGIGFAAGVLVGGLLGWMGSRRR
jgi:ElaB/YqjD/DUF883 family membrane-anchored ribosome-binding protein